MRHRVVLADDHGVLVEGLRKLLEAEFDIIATAPDGLELIAVVARLQPDIVVLDIGMPLLNGIEAGRRVRKEYPAIKLVFLTQQSDRAYIREAFLIGASAYILKQSAASELKAALKQVVRGCYFISPSLAGDDISARFNPNANPAGLFGKALTSRQREVLQLVAEGKPAKEISALLGISVKTVEYHKAMILEELGLRTSAELIRYAIDHGIVS